MQTLEGSESKTAAPSMQARMYQHWTKTIAEYSARRLTRDSDKLPAIQSIAAEMSATINDTYITTAGMWKANLKHDLLWQVVSGPATTPSKYRAPSWSWASLDARLQWWEGLVFPKASLPLKSQASFDVLDVIEFGPEDAQKSMLKVKAILKPLVTIRECTYEDRWVYGDRGSFPYDVYVSVSPPVQYDPPARPELQQQLVEQGNVVLFAVGNLDLDGKDGLHVSGRTLAYLHVDNSYHPSGLILEWVDDTEGTWKRVGVASVFKDLIETYLTPCFAEDDRPVEVTII